MVKMSWTYILVLISLIWDIRGQGIAPTISPYPIASVEKGQSLTLTCDYTGPQNITTLVIDRNGTTIGIILVRDTNPCATYQLLANTTLYNVECSTGNVFRVTILSVSEDENNLLWKCNVRVNGSYVASDETRILVIVGITSVSLVSPSGDPVSVVENNEQQFQCETSVGNPQAAVEWYKDNGTPINLMDDYLITTGNTTETSPSGPLLVTIGKLKLAVQKADNGLGVYCRANNGGIWQYSSRSVNLDVKFVPDNGPVIQDFTHAPNYYMIRNSPTEQQLTCTVTGGNPLASLNWSCYGSPHNGTILGETVTRTVKWTSGTKNDSTCTCKASHSVGWSRSTSVNVSVLDAPSAPQCSVGTSTVLSGTLKIIRGSSLTINCASDGNPPPHFTWTLPNYVTSAGPELTLNKVQTAATYTLNVTNTMTPSIGQPQPGSNNAYFSTEILFPPSTPTFHFGNTSGTEIPNNRLSVVRGNNLTVACVSSANPDPKYSWVGTNQLWMFKANTNTSEECRVKNTMTPTGNDPVTKDASSTLDITVLYPPLSPVLQYQQCSGTMTRVPSLLKVIKGQSVKVKCQTDSSPPPRYSWSAHQSSLSHEFTIAAVDKQHHGSYTCAVSNQMVTTFDGTVPGMNSSTFNMDVLFPPVVHRLNNVTVLEGNTTTINCTITHGNPPETTFKWTRNQIEVIKQQQLRIEMVTRQQSGVYTCFASNVMRPSGCDSRTEPDHKDVFVDVQYPSKVKNVQVENFGTEPTVTINESVPFKVICNVDGNPKSDIKLHRDGNVITEATQVSSVYFVQPSSDCERDMAVYTCNAKNTYNDQASSKNLTLFVRCKPRAQHNVRLDVNVTTSIGVNATLTFKVAAYPPPNVGDYTWERLEQNGSWTQLSNKSSIFYVVSETNLLTQLSILGVEKSDFSFYRVNVSNTLGTTSHIFHLRAKEKPYPPFDLKYILVEDVNQVILKWTPGFDGGLAQNFTVEYKIGSTTRWVQEQVGVGTYNHTLTRLDYGKQYDARVFAENSKGSSNYSNIIKFVTASKEGPPINLGVVVGAPVGGLGIAALIIVVVVLGIRFRRKQSKSNAENMSLTTRNKQKTHSINTDEDMDDDLPDEIENPMYVGGDTVQKSVADSSCIYSQPQKTKAKGTGDIYAVVQKKDKKKKPKAATKAEKKNEDIYENADKRTYDNKAFASASTNETNGTKPNKKLVNKDGLVYADIVFPNPPKGQKRLNIIGIDDMTEYAVVDLTKKADPLPESDDETSHKTGK